MNYSKEKRSYKQKVKQVNNVLLKGGPRLSSKGIPSPAKISSKGIPAPGKLPSSLVAVKKTKIKTSITRVFKK